MIREIVLYVPTGGRSTARIPRGSAIVGAPRFGAREVEVYFESAAPERRGLRTLADRALSASGRMLERAVFGGCLLVPPKALTIVGTFNFAEGSIALTGPQSERAVLIGSARRSSTRGSCGNREASSPGTNLRAPARPRPPTSSLPFFTRC